MHLVARVFDLEITEDEVRGESENLIGQESSLALIHALNRLIDRCLLFHQALGNGFSATEDEFDSALLETLEDIETAPKDNYQTRILEERIRRRIIVRKYVQQICARDIPIGDDQLLSFYEDQKEVFFVSEAVRASHILIRANEENAEQRIRELQNRIHSRKDFEETCKEHSHCPTGEKCGDLGWFPRGRMIREIEDAAFSLEAGQISDVFRSRYGWHILMVTDKKTQEPVPFEEIKDSLKARLAQLEREFFLTKHVSDLRKNSSDQILILDQDYIIPI